MVTVSAEFSLEGTLKSRWGTLNLNGGTLNLYGGRTPPRPPYNLITDYTISAQVPYLTRVSEKNAIGRKDVGTLCKNAYR